MIVTVTANTTLDHNVIIPALESNKTIRAVSSVYSMGGKPTDASFILGTLGTPSRALGFAAGLVGQKVETMLRARGVHPDFIQVGGETRINIVMAGRDDHSHTTITTSTLEIAPEHLEALRERYQTTLKMASCVVLGGTLPKAMQPEFYTDYIQLARAHSVPTIFDASEPNLSAGLAANPTYIKPNQDELSALVGHPVTTLDEAYHAGRTILEQHGTAPIITLGSEGGLAVLPERAYRIPPLKIEVVSAGGAGDAVLAGLAYSLDKGLPIEDGLRLGFAAAAAVCLMPGTADCRPEDVERLLPQVELVEYTP